MPVLPRLSARTERRVRRAVAAVCLLLAAVSWFGGRAPARPATAGAATVAAVPHGLDAVPVPVRAAASRLVHVGDRIDLVATQSEGVNAPTGPVATGVRVLAVLGTPDSGVSSLGSAGAAAALLVAVDHPTALRLAALPDTSPLAVVLPGS
jgi:hypothetical protein